MPKIFVSYAKADEGRPEFLALLSDLERLRHKVWHDTMLTGGQPWWQRILQEIRDCSLFVMAGSTSWKTSEACRSEREYAAAVRRPMLCVEIDSIESALPASLATSQVVNYTQRAKSAQTGTDCLFALREALDAISIEEAPPLPEPLPPTPPVPESYRLELQEMLDQGELSFAEQQDFLNRIRFRIDDRASAHLARLLGDFLDRPEVSYRAHQAGEELMRMLRGKDAEPPPPPPPDNGHTPGRSEDGSHSGTLLTQEVKENLKDVRQFYAPQLDVARMERSLATWLESQNLEVQTYDSGQERLIQARSAKWQRAIGAGTALTVVLWTTDETLNVGVGGAKWIDKAMAGGVGWFVFWPAILPAISGGWKQYHMPQKVFEFVERSLPTCVLTH